MGASGIATTPLHRSQTPSPKSWRIDGAAALYKDGEMLLIILTCFVFMNFRDEAPGALWKVLSRICPS